MTEWIMLILILNGGHAYELSRPYPTEQACIDATKHVAIGMMTTVNCVPAPKPEEAK